MIPIITLHLLVFTLFLCVTVLIWMRVRQKGQHARHEWYWLLSGYALFVMASMIDLFKMLHPSGDAPPSLTNWTDQTKMFAYWSGIALLTIGAVRQLAKTVNEDEIHQIMDKLVASFVNKEIRHQEMADVIEKHHSISRMANDGILSMDGAGNIIFWNQGAERIFGHCEHEILGQSIGTLIHPEYQEHPVQKLTAIGMAEQSDLTGKIIEMPGLKKNGDKVPLEMTLSTWSMKNNRYFVAVMRDISHRKEQEEFNRRIAQSRLAISEILQLSLEPLPIEEFMDKALQIILSVPWVKIESKGCIFLTDANTGELVMTAQINLSKFLLLTCAKIQPGYCLCGRAAKTKEVVFSNELDHRHDVQFDGMREHGHYCIPIIFQNNIYGVLNLYVPHAHNADPEEISFLMAIANTLAGVVERKRMEEQLKELAGHDELTGLPNRREILRNLHQDLALAIRESRILVVMMMDLDHFKQVNDILGHEAGDLLLIEVANRMKECLRMSDTIGRLGGDEFIALLPSIRYDEDAQIVAEKLISIISQPYTIKGQECLIGVSIGISMYPMHGSEAHILLQKADMALYAVKEERRNNYKFFSDEIT
ncbi:MAG: diguanylate cyclase [Magnetococcus sp. YQC-5]